MRHIGIRHRNKQTAEGEARPTQVCVLEVGKKNYCYDLLTETDELDWLLGRFPLTWRLAKRGKDEKVIKKLPEHLQRYRKVRSSEKLSASTHFLKTEKGKPCVLEIPDRYDGLSAGDIVGMVLGGSGDRLACALSRRADELSKAQVLRLRPALLKTLREEHFKRDKDEDALTLAELARDQIEKFLVITKRDRDLIRLTEAWRDRADAMLARIAAEQRLRSHLIGNIFCSNEGKYPEGSIERLYENERANDKIILALVAEEKVRNREVEKIIQELPVYTEIFAHITGIGPMIAARIIVAIGNPLRFQTAAKMKAFLGVHLTPEGRFVRRRAGVVANWHPDGRQALYLLGDQLNRRPQSEWGQKLIAYKAKFRAKHLLVECTCGLPWDQCLNQCREGHRRRYTDGHIHKMATWRTLTKFTEWLWREWTKLENPAKTSSQSHMKEAG